MGVFIYALGGVSGANFNPAVSVALAVSKALGGPGIEMKDMGAYIVTQVAGGLAAAFTYKTLLGDSVSVQPQDGYSIIGAGLCEMAYTAILCFVVLNVAVAKKNQPNQYYGIAIGFVIIAGAYGAGAVSGGCFNPAVAIGLGASSGSTLLVFTAYVGCELAGSLIAAVLFRVVRMEDFGGVIGLPQKLLSEFLGTFVLVLTVGLNVMASSAAGAFSIAAGLTSMIFALGSVSGAHFNPAVSTAIVLTPGSGFTPSNYAAYVVVQLLAGVAATMSCQAIAPVFSDGVFSLGPGKHYTLTQALIGEAFFTFVLAFVVLSVAVSSDTKSADLFGLAIGGCVVVGGFAVGAISGGSLNPAVSFGLGIIPNTTNALLYSLVELVAGALAAGTYVAIQKPQTEKYESLVSPTSGSRG